MIVIYPLLVTDSVSKNIVPGLAKIIERYLLIYKIDEVLQAAKTGGSKKRYKIKGGKIFTEEDKFTFDPNFPHITKASQLGKGPQSRTKPFSRAELDKRKKDEREEQDTKRKEAEAEYKRKKDEREEQDIKRKEAEAEYKRKKDEREEQDIKRKEEEAEYKRKKEEREQKKAEQIAKSATMDIGAMDMQSLSAEPTWVKVDIVKGDLKTTELLGIKVVPIMVKSSEKLVRVLMFDKNVKGLHAKVLTYGRRMIRGLWKIWDRVWSTIPMFGGGRTTPSGDARKDILLQRSIYSNNNKANMFLSINFQDLDDDLFFNNAQSLNKLFKKGWESFIVCDDVNRMAYFCMEEFKGMTTSISYAMMYQTLGQLKVYESLEEAQRSSTSLFKVKTKTNKLFSIVLAKQKLNKYRKK